LLLPIVTKARAVFAAASPLSAHLLKANLPEVSMSVNSARFKPVRGA